jgi:outer membrane lipoprotein-sorting protein
LKIDLKTLLKIITGENDLSKKDVLYVGQERNKFIYKSEDERWTKEYWIDSKKCCLTRSVWTDKKKGEVYEIEYKNFSSHQNVRLANVIEIKSTAKESVHGESAKIKFIERKFNLLIPEKKFQLEIPPDAKRITFEPNM